MSDGVHIPNVMNFSNNKRPLDREDQNPFNHKGAQSKSQRITKEKHIVVVLSSTTFDNRIRLCVPQCRPLCPSLSFFK